VRFVGWGAFPQVFEKDHPEWGEVGRELCALLTPEDFEKAAASTPNAHYTSETVIRGIYGVLARLGFAGGRVLEPALGIGHFIGLLPNELAVTTRWTGIELDPTTGRIAQALYPECDIRIQGFEDASLADGTFDLVIGNVPFGRYPVHDPVHNPQGFRIHDYFFARSLAAVRPSGVVAMLTSRFTLDKLNGAVREHLAERADLLGALRLPNTAFRANAGTEVTTDLLILQRRPNGAPPAGEAWLETVEVETPDGPARINEYFARHPHMMLGELRLTGTMYRAHEPTLVARPGEELGEAITAAALHLPADVFGRVAASHAPEPVRIAPTPEIDPSVRDGAFVLVDGELRIRDGARLVEHGLRSAKEVRRVIALVGLRDAVRRVLTSQHRERPQAEQEAARAELNRLYDRFVLRWGPINHEVRVEDRRGRTFVRRPNLAPFRRDPEAMNVAALEAVQPEDLKPSEIDAALGSAWIPREDIEQFIRDLLGSVAERAVIEIAHLAREAAWRVSAPPWVLSSVEARMMWGTERAHAIRLIEDSLNQRITSIYDTVEEIDPETGRKRKRTVRNVQASLDAQEKQRTIQERFASWVWEEPQRATWLLQRYNETFNGTRLREYDGSHLTLPGASDAIQLDPHQKNFIWRVLQDGNALAAHAEAAAAGDQGTGGPAGEAVQPPYQGSRAVVRGAGNRRALHRRGPRLQKSRLSEQDPGDPPAEQAAAAGDGHADEVPVPGDGPARPRYSVRYGHADLQQHLRDLRDAPLSRTRPAGAGRPESLRCMGGDLHAPGNRAGALAGWVLLPDADAVPLQQRQRTGGDVPHGGRCADGGAGGERSLAGCVRRVKHRGGAPTSCHPDDHAQQESFATSLVKVCPASLIPSPHVR
jgi:hypothetical protein